MVETSILAESALPINPASTQVVPAASVNIQSVSPASLQDSEIPVASTIAEGTSPLGPSLVWDNGSTVLSPAQVIPPALSQPQQVIPASATGAEAFSARASSQVLGTAAVAEIPGSSQILFVSSPQGSPLMQGATSVSDEVASPASSMVQHAMPSMSTIAMDTISPISSLAPNETAPSTQADASSQLSLSPTAQEGQSGGTVQTTVPNSSIHAEQTAVSSEEISHASPEATSHSLFQGNASQVSPFY